MNQIVMPLLLSAVAMPSVWAQGNEWTGFYAGGHLGYGFGESKVDVSLGGSWGLGPQVANDYLEKAWSKDLSPSGAVGGLQAGYNYQLPGSQVVLGLEGAASWLDASDSKRRMTYLAPVLPVDVGFDSRLSIDVERTLALRAKAGFIVDRTLYYGTVGWSWARAEMGFEILSTNGYSRMGGGTKTLDGFTIGLGVEHRITQQLSLRADYSYSDYGRVSYETAYRPGSTGGPPAFNYAEKVSQDLSLHQINIGLNYSF